MVRLEAEAESHYGGMLPHTSGHLSIDLPVANSQYAVTVQALFTFNEAKSRWEFGDLSKGDPDEFIFGQSPLV
jgi:hypothetical protein